MKLIVPLFIFSTFALAHQNPTQEQIRLKLWYEGLSIQKVKSAKETSPKAQIEEIERPLQRLFNDE